MNRLLALMFALLLAVPAAAQEIDNPPGSGGGGGGMNTNASNAVQPDANLNIAPPGTTDSYFAKNYGGCAWDGTSGDDVGVCINAAISAAAANGGGTVITPCGTFFVATQIANSTSGVRFVGCGIGIPRDNTDPTKFIAYTTLKWNGAADATMALWNASSTTSLFAADVDGVLFDCNATAAICWQGKQISFSRLNIGASESRSIGISLTANVGGDAPGSQHNEIWFYARHTATSDAFHPTGILIDSAGGTRNTSINSQIHLLYAWYNSGDGIVVGDADENDFELVRVFPEPSVNNGRPIVMANAGYTMPNGVTVGGKAYSNRIHHAEGQIYLLGQNTGIAVATGVHTGTGSYNPVTISTNATTPSLDKTLHFASTTGIVAGETVDCGSGSNMYRDTLITSVTGTTLVMTDEAYGIVPSSKSCTSHVGMTVGANGLANGVAGTYTITFTNATTANITAPAGGHSQTGIVAAGGALTFTDMVFPFTGSPAANDTFTVTVPLSSFNNNVDWLDRNNAIALPQLQPGATSGFIATSAGQMGFGVVPDVSDAHTVTIGGTLKANSALTLSGTLSPTALSGDVNNYNPTGLSAALALRIDGGASDRNITGLAGGADGRIIEIINVGATNNLTLVNNSGSSSAGNKFLLPADTILPINTALALRYDGTSSVWRPWSRALSNTGATAGAYSVLKATIDAAGRVTVAANAAASDLPATTLATGTSVSLTAPREYYVCTGTCTVTPPVPAAGYEFCVRNDNNVATVITLAALGSSAMYEKTTFTSYGTAGTGTAVSGGAAGDKLCIVGRDSTHYLVLSSNGTWTMN